MFLPPHSRQSMESDGQQESKISLNLTKFSTVYFQYASGEDLNLISLLPSSLSVFCHMFGISCLGPGRLRQSLFTHQARTPTDDTYRHSLSTPVEGGHFPTIQHQHPPPHNEQFIFMLVFNVTVCSDSCTFCAAQYVGISICCSYALHTCLQAVDPGRHR